jgi:hypothetical protein
MSQCNLQPDSGRRGCGNSCATIRVCKGTYAEQVTIRKPLTIAADSGAALMPGTMQQNATMAVTGTTCANTEPLGIGAKNRTATGVVEAYFDGRIDDLRVYNRALTAAEIKTVRTTALT